MESDIRLITADVKQHVSKCKVSVTWKRAIIQMSTSHNLANNQDTEQLRMSAKRKEIPLPQNHKRMYHATDASLAII